MNQVITQKTLAQALRLHVSTVSKALRGDPQIARATRDAVAAKAAALGYRRDPMLSALANHRRGIGGRSVQAVIAWIHNHPPDHDMGIFPGYGEYFEGARRRAESLGYLLERFYIDPKTLSPAQLIRVMDARTIRAVVVAPQAGSTGRLDLPWDRLCAVTIGYTLKEPALDLVTNDHFSTMTELIIELQNRGYRRVGCYLSHPENERMGRRASSAFQAWSRELNLKLKLFGDFAEDDFVSWVRRSRLDAVIAPGQRGLAALRAAGLDPPRRLGLAGYALAEDEAVVSGMSHNNRRIGELAIDFLCRAFEHGQFGLSEFPVRTLVPPRWLENKTLRV